MELSSVIELAPLAEVVGEVSHAAARAGVPILVAGAFARDLWLWYVHHISTGRATEDVDFAVQCEDWRQFEAVSIEMVGAGLSLEDPRVQHRFRHPNGTRIDLVPFGGIERHDRTIAWPPDQGQVMNLLGFQEMLETAVVFRLPRDVSIPVVSLPSLASLKLIAWRDRAARQPGKDAADLDTILRHYADAGNSGRMFDEITGLADREDFDYELAGAELLGWDLAKSAGPELLGVLCNLLERESDPSGELRLAREMVRGDEESARRRLASLLDGLTKGNAAG